MGDEAKTLARALGALAFWGGRVRLPVSVFRPAAKPFMEPDQWNRVRRWRAKKKAGDAQRRAQRRKS